MTLPKWKQKLKEAKTQEELALWNRMNMDIHDNDLATAQTWNKLENIYCSNKLLERLKKYHGDTS